MPYEINVNHSHFKSETRIITCKDIIILPFEGQGQVAVKKAPSTPAKKSVPENGAANGAGRFNVAQRKQVSQPTGKLTTNNIGIKDTLNPKKKKTSTIGEDVNPDLAEAFTIEQLQHVWKEYSLISKRNKKNSLHSTLTNSKMTVSSDYQIHLELVSISQQKEIEAVKAELLGFLRSKLKNYGIGLNYTIVKTTKTQLLDSKGTFDKLAEDNSSLNKFRKLFNLDIEF